VNGVDVAHKFELVPDPEKLRSRLYELHHIATDPPVGDIDIQSVEDPNSQGGGFVVCFVPVGNFVPYRAELNIKNDYIRIGDDSIITPPVFLRRLFYPQSLARIVMRAALVQQDLSVGPMLSKVWHYRVGLTNTGTST
jgi:hypothetical protein